MADMRNAGRKLLEEVIKRLRDDYGIDLFPIVAAISNFLTRSNASTAPADVGLIEGNKLSFPASPNLNVGDDGNVFTYSNEKTSGQGQYYLEISTNDQYEDKNGFGLLAPDNGVSPNDYMVAVNSNNPMNVLNNSMFVTAVVNNQLLVQVIDSQGQPNASFVSGTITGGLAPRIGVMIDDQAQEIKLYRAGAEVFTVQLPQSSAQGWYYSLGRSDPITADTEGLEMEIFTDLADWTEAPQGNVFKQWGEA